MAQLGKTKNVAVAFVGKVKTAAQMTAIIALLLWEPLIPGLPTPVLGTFALWVAAVLTLWSMFHYLRLAAPYLAADSVTGARSTRNRKAGSEGKAGLGIGILPLLAGQDANAVRMNASTGCAKPFNDIGPAGDVSAASSSAALRRLMRIWPPLASSHRRAARFTTPPIAE